VSAGLPLILLLIFLSSVCDTLNQFFLKSAINSLNVSLSARLIQVVRFVAALILLPRVWLGFFCSAISLCLWLFVLSRVDLNFAFSLDSMHYILIAVASRLFLKERVGAKRWFGTCLIIVGIILVSLS
jgi:drug/metabolite transporter (DMT)-like permease